MRRLFIVDPVCALPYGHNVNALHYFHRHFESLGWHTHAIASRLLPEALCAGRIAREFTFLYGEFIDVAGLMDDAEAEFVRALGTAHERIAVAAGEMRAFYEAYDIGADDTVFFPSVDFYTLMGAIIASSGNAERKPMLRLRFIGVLEHVADAMPDARHRMMGQLHRFAHANPDRVRLSAETPTLAEAMAGELALPVEVTPYPLAHPAAPMATDGPLVVLAAGAARIDKGYLRLRAIYDEAARIIERGRVEFLIQSAPDDVLVQSLEHTAALYRLPHVNVLPAVLSQEMMETCYRRAHVVIMPYDAEIYRERGSAVMQEAVSFGRYVVGQRGTGFARQIAHYGVGQVAHSDLNFAVQLARIDALPRDQLAELAAAGRARYAADAVRAYAGWAA